MWCSTSGDLHVVIFCCTTGEPSIVSCLEIVVEFLQKTGKTINGIENWHTKTFGLPASHLKTSFEWAQKIIVPKTHTIVLEWRWRAAARTLRTVEYALRIWSATAHHYRDMYQYSVAVLLHERTIFLSTL